MPKSCVICGDPTPCEGYETCGHSYCQETRHYLNRARNAKKRDRAGFQKLADAAMARVDERKAQRQLREVGV